MHRAKLVLSIVGLLTPAVVFGLLLGISYREQELWKVVAIDGSATTVVGQQRWFGRMGVHLIRRQQNGSGRLVNAVVVGHADTWSDAKAKANALHRQRYYCDSLPYFDEQVNRLVTGMADSTQLVAYEGLPHQFWEKDLLDQELKAGRSIRLHNFPFYKTPVPIAAADEKRLSALCSATATFRLKRGAKACGGFHPDWCLQWRGVDGDCRMLLCFGCCEAKLYGPRNEIYCDLEKESLVEFRAILKRYRTNRPGAEPAYCQ